MQKEKIIDCLFIGHNEMDFVEYERIIRRMGIKSGTYRDLNMNFIIYDNRPYTISEIFNIFHEPSQGNNIDGAPPLHVAESFSASIAYLGTYLARRGYTFDYVNAFQYSKTQLAEKIQKGNILVTAIITTLYVSMLPIVEIIEFIKRYNRTTKIIVGGPFVATQASTMFFLRVRGIEWLKQYGIVTFGNFIIGFPGETAETVKDTVDFIETAGLDFYRTQLWYCDPFTPIFAQKDLYQIQGESFEWSHATMNAQKSCEIIENIFLKIENPTWVPQYNFDFDGIWHLVHRGMSIEQVRNFLKCFNNMVREKIIGATHGEGSNAALKQLRNACTNIKKQTRVANE